MQRMESLVLKGKNLGSPKPCGEPGKREDEY